MRPRHAIAPRRAVSRLIVGIAVAVSLAVGGTIAVTEVALAKDQSRAGRASAGRVLADRRRERATHVIGTVHIIGSAAQAAARSYWTPARLESASGVGAGARAGSSRPGSGRPASAGAPAVERQDAATGSSAAQSPPHGTPNSQSFSGVPTVGALFYTKAGSNHFCTASVIHSTAGSLVVTAAHCVYSSNGYSQHMEFIPGYDGGSESYGVWPVTQITVAKGWRQGENPDLDVAFLNVVPPPNSVGPIEQVTGSLQIAFALPDAQRVTVIGYNDTDQKPIMCTTTSFKFRPDQMEFYCRGFWYGTSGGPWILNYNSSSGAGTIYGVIGGYEAGGNVTWASYSAALEKPAQELLAQAEASAGTSNAANAGGGKSSGTQVTASAG
jgi:V8-like Glu-specific endopeptidase